ncbi:CNNM domain-containing protein [Flavobacteriaceae bacterium S356]|uniref:CNNM domain-containing protein n=1 Tax=Asprobacillus argus TaxID=3076534 RepID=A0ABU3LFN9_9FLAO|nr:CNNM domain-containing protein [Flavobacteriaceae bacterium S356]
MTLLIIFATLSIFFSFLCSILEAVLLSVTPTFINVKKKEGKAFASQLEILKNDVDKPLIAILTLNTVAHTVGAILVGVQAEQLPYKIDLFGMNIVGIVSAIMTILILVVSEIIPKTIGATHWKKLAGFSTSVLSILIFVFKWTGILWILQLFTKIFGKGGHGSVLSREDFTAMADIAEQEGVFQESESKVIKNLLNFKEVLVRDIMTPRSVLKTANEEQTIQEFFDENPMLRFSRIPMYAEQSDNITGYFLKDQLLEAIIKGNGDQPLKNIKRTILVTKRSLPIPNLFEQLIDQREHIALVVDEYGSVSGLVTQEDMIETLLGLEIMDESDNIEDLQLLARKSWERRAKRLGIIDDELKE